MPPSVKSKPRQLFALVFLVAVLILPLAYSSGARSAALPHAIAWTDKGPDAYIVHSLSPVDNDPGIFISLNDTSATCVSAVMVCGHSFMPVGVTENSSVTLRIGSAGFEARYSCQRVDGHMTWIQTGSTGSCASTQVINIPATFARARIRNIG